MTEQQSEYTKGKTIFRVEKNKDNPFVMIDRRVIENPKLSWKAKGLLAYLLSRPDDWVVRFRDLTKRAPDGAHTIRAAVKELKDAGHVRVVVERGENGRAKRWVYKVYEVPLSDFQQVDFQQVDNRTLNNTDSFTNTDSTNTGDGSPLPLDWQIGMGVKTIQLLSEKDVFISKVRDAANLIDFQCPGAGKLAEAFMLARGIIIPSSKAKANRKAAREMMEQGVQAEHITQATAALVGKNLTVVDLFSVSKTAIALANPVPGEMVAFEETPEQLEARRAEADRLFGVQS